MRSPSPSAPRFAVGYVRVSTEDQAASGLGLEAQRTQLLRAAHRLGLHLATIEVDAGVSATARKRPGLEAAVSALEARGAPGVLLVAKLDRLARSVATWSRLVERGHDSGWTILALDTPESSTAQGEAMAGVVAVFAQLERRLISERTRDGLAAAKARGQRLGAPAVSPEVAALILELRGHGLTARGIARELDARGVPTLKGAEGWHHHSVARILGRETGEVLRKGQQPQRRRGRRVRGTSSTAESPGPQGSRPPVSGA